MPWWQYAEFDWDDGNVEHLADRHDVLPEDAEAAVLSATNVRREGDRYKGFGRSAGGHVLFVVFENRRGMVRVISARRVH